MDPEYLLSKLEPLIPDQVRHWRRIRDTAGADSSALIDRAIAEAAHRHLGEYREKILLSLPPKQRARGAFHLGTILYDRPRWPFGISSKELLQGVAIFGRSGGGKTNLTFHLVRQLTESKMPWLFWDWKRTARHLLPLINADVQVFTPGRSLSPFIFNPFIVPPGMEQSVYTTQLVDVMSDAFSLGEGSRSILQKAIAACYAQGNEAPTVADIADEVDHLPSTGRMAGWKLSASRALESLAFARVAGTTRSSQEDHAKALLESQTIIELDALSESSKRFLVPILSQWLYAVRLASPVREKLSLVIVVEEAHHLLYRSEQRSKESVMNRLLRQCREIGIGIIVVDQHPHLISSAALGNTYTSICLNLKDPSDINRAAGLSQVPDQEKRYFSMLPVGQGIVKLQDRWHKPFLVQFPLVDVNKGAVTDALLKRYIDGSHGRSLLRATIQAESPNDSPVGTGDRYLAEDEFRLLHDVLLFPDDAVRVRFARLGFSGRLGMNVKERLLSRGWLVGETIKSGTTSSLRLAVPTHAAELLGANVKRILPELVVHEYWQRHYGSLFQDRGYAIELEAPRSGGRVDVLATKEGKCIGVEIETGKSDAVANVQNGLRSRFAQVLVVATGEAALKKVERQLAEAGLFIPGRVRLVLRDGFEENEGP